MMNTMPKQAKIIHIDMDCFYAAIEMRDFPELAHKPVAVGGDANRRGVISTCNYAARHFGVHSAMSTAQALQRCPQLVLQPCRMDVYREESQYIREIFADYTDLVEPLSLDEAYLDVTDCELCSGSATWIARQIRERIYSARQLTASAGIAPNKCLAKIASDWHKPNGQMVIRPADVAQFMKLLPVRKLFGVGPKMEQRLLALGIQTCSDLQHYSHDALTSQFGSMGGRLYELARGIDFRPVSPDRARKSISVEETYPMDLLNVEACLMVLPALLTRLERRIERACDGVSIHAVFIKLKFSNFQQTTVERVYDSLEKDNFSQLIREGFDRHSLPVRLLGIGIKLKLNTSEQGKQLQLPLHGQ